MMNREKFDLVILTPVFNDWDSLSILAGRIKDILKSVPAIQSYLIVGVNDGSSIDPDTNSLRNNRIEILHLQRNLGHQRAIAIGLAYVAEMFEHHYVLVMDADGEDKPEDIVTLLDAASEGRAKIIFGHRTKRTEGLLFRFFYAVYKMIFRILTGKSIGFGNFSIIPSPLLCNLVHISEIWNNYPVGIVRSKIPYSSVAVERGRRYAGSSKMNFSALILHGMSAIAIQIDIVSIRVILATILILFAAGVGLVAAFLVRMFTDLSVPGWTSTIMVNLMMFLVQSFLISLLLILMVLSYRTQKLFIPALDYKYYIHKSERIE